MANVKIGQVAKWFLSKESMTQKRLQKLCYYADAWFYTLKGEMLTGEAYEAWVHGPVSPTLRRILGRTELRDISVTQFGQYDDITDVDTLEFMEIVWNTYGDLDGNSLEILTHSERPWKEARAGLEPFVNSNNVISYDTMREFYKTIYTDNTYDD